MTPPHLSLEAWQVPMLVMLSGERRLQDEPKRKEVQMDSRTDPKTQDTSASKSTGCCGRKAEAQPLAKAEPRVAEKAEGKQTKSGCCCGQN